ncbi:MAG: hypothetical protein ACPGWR_00950 [Ardenticatenaceae bacterium]
MSVEVKISERLARLFVADVGKVARASELAVGVEAQNRIAIYPQATAANDSNQQRWYERGRGGFRRTLGGAVRRTSSSETLGRRWSLNSQGGGTVLRNLASYAPFVHAKDKQAGFHGQRGWRTNEQVAKGMKADGTVRKIVKQQVKRLLNL